MNWNEFLLWSRLAFIGCCALVVQLTLSLVAVQAGREAKTATLTVSDEPLSAEQLAVYHVILTGWVDDGKQAVHLGDRTVPFTENDQECVKKAALEPIDSTLVHRFRAEDLPQLGSRKIALVDADGQEKDVARNDPGAAIRNGKSVDAAVRDGLDHGLVTLSEIRFDSKHELAIVWYGFHCGSLCGNGATVVMEKRDGVWRRKNFCSLWM